MEKQRNVVHISGGIGIFTIHQLVVNQNTGMMGGNRKNWYLDTLIAEKHDGYWVSGETGWLYAGSDMFMGG